MSKEFPAFDGKEETVVGVHHSGIELEEGLNTSTNRNLCSNCKRNVHCFVKVDRETHEAVIHKTCKTPDCECRCKTHFSCRSCGYLHPYGSKCNREEIKRKRDPKADQEFDKLMAGWRKETDENNSLSNIADQRKK